jgi:adenine-specific DNA-methyltransferase
LKTDLRRMGAAFPERLVEAVVIDGLPANTVELELARRLADYERVPHITLKDIANNAEIDVIWESWQEKIHPLLCELGDLCGEDFTTKDTKAEKEWLVPRESRKHWSAPAKACHEKCWDARIARRKEIDASIAAKAGFEYLYDKPYTDKDRIRVAGPFTVESLSPYRITTR